MDSLKIQNVKVSYDRANLLERIANRIRRSLELPEILSATAAEVQSFLGTDRVKIYKFHNDAAVKWLPNQLTATACHHY